MASESTTQKKKDAKHPPQRVDEMLAQQKPITPLDIVRMYEAGMAVGIANAALFHPIDTLRIRTFFKKEGRKLGTSRSFFNGLGFNLVSTAIKQMATYPTQDVVKRHFTQAGYNTHQSQFYSSIVSGLGLGLVATPISVIKVPLQASSVGRYTFLSVVRDTYNAHGLLGFFRGGAGNILRDTSWCMIYFPLYGALREKVEEYDIHIREALAESALSKNRNNNTRPSTTEEEDASHHPTITRTSTSMLNLVSSITASSLAMVVSYPFDGARLYRQRHPSQGDYTFWYGFYESLKPNKFNLRSFASGLIRVPLSTAFCHVLYLYLSSSHAEKKT